MSTPRTCRVCGQTKPITDYPRSKSYRDGFETRCKACKRVYTQQLKQRRREPQVHVVEDIRLSVRKTGNELMPWVVSDGQKINVSCVSVGQAVKVKDVVLKYLNGEIPDKPIKVVYKSPTETALARRRQRAAQAA